ncbi:MAG: 50S ribosomal protein L25 [Chloroflexi bacterium]|nr:50S ribosomal protein L25 [Chloroflexota bacterium]
MEQLKLKARKREGTGTSYCRKVRREGWIPAVLYGRGSDAVLLEVDRLEFNKLAMRAGYTSLINLALDNNGEEAYLALIKESKEDNFHKEYIHVDFYHVKLDEKVTAKVPIHLHGEAAGIKEGGSIEHILREVEIEALPLDLPDHLTLDVTNLKIDDSLTVADIPRNEKIDILTQEDEVIVVVNPPRKLEEAEVPVVEGAVVEAAPAQPELVGRKTEEQE